VVEALVETLVEQRQEERLLALEVCRSRRWTARPSSAISSIVAAW